MIRYAIVVNARTRHEAEAYLPENYEIVHEAKDVQIGLSRDKPYFVIAGQDVAGWTLDSYVIPRYQSGMIGCKEVTNVHELAEITS